MLLVYFEVITFDILLVVYLRRQQLDWPRSCQLQRFNLGVSQDIIVTR